MGLSSVRVTPTPAPSRLGLRRGYHPRVSLIYGPQVYKWKKVRPSPSGSGGTETHVLVERHCSGIDRVGRREANRVLTENKKKDTTSVYLERFYVGTGSVTSTFRKVPTGRFGLEKGPLSSGKDQTSKSGRDPTRQYGRTDH